MQTQTRYRVTVEGFERFGRGPKSETTLYVIGVSWGKKPLQVEKFTWSGDIKRATTLSKIHAEALVAAYAGQFRMALVPVENARAPMPYVAPAARSYDACRYTNIPGGRAE